MSKKYQNGFFFFGLTVLIIMVTQLDFAEVWKGLLHAGYWFFAVIALWAVLYLFNTAAWWVIIGSQETVDGLETAHQRKPITFGQLYKVTVSAFALNYATPGGLMGGEPYRVMELAPYIGKERAASSVILYVMTHIFSHFWFWLIAIIIYLITQPLTPFMAVVLTMATAFCLLGLWFFIRGYRKGLAVRGLNIIRHLPFIKGWANRFIEQHRKQLDTIDRQIAALHQQAYSTFITAVMLEVGCRIASAVEILFILHVVMPSVNYWTCLLILAFTSLFANLLFFMPLQLGGREGGFLMSTTGLGITASNGIFVALIVRIRELVWTGIGLLLIKVTAGKPAPPTGENNTPKE